MLMTALVLGGRPGAFEQANIPFPILCQPYNPHGCIAAHLLKKISPGTKPSNIKSDGVHCLEICPSESSTAVDSVQTTSAETETRPMRRDRPPSMVCRSTCAPASTTDSDLGRGVPRAFCSSQGECKLAYMVQYHTFSPRVRSLLHPLEKTR